MCPVMHIALSGIKIRRCNRNGCKLELFVIISAVDRLRLLMIINLLRCLSCNQWCSRRFPIACLRNVLCIADGAVIVFDVRDRGRCRWDWRFQSHSFRCDDLRWSRRWSDLLHVVMIICRLVRWGIKCLRLLTVDWDFVNLLWAHVERICGRLI